MHWQVIIAVLIATGLLSISFVPSSISQIPSFGASECNAPGQENIFISQIDNDEARFWVIPNHEISLNPNAGPWKKSLLPESPGIVQVDDSTIQGSDQTFFAFTETITINPNSVSFTDWHEEIDAPGWSWDFSDVTFSDSNIQENTDVEEVIVDNVITIFFDPPIPPGTEFTIEKALVFVGSDGNLDTIPTETSSFSDVNPLIVLQYPTGNISCEPDDDQPVGGDFISIDMSSLILAGSQTNSVLMLAITLSIVGLGVLFFRKKMF